MLIFGVTALFAVTLPLATMQAQRRVYKLDEGGIIAPKLTQKQEPAYTQAARDAKIEGRVKIEAVIEVDGRIDEAKVIDSLDEGLDANAIAAVKSWRFDPARKAGEPVPVAVRIEVNFRLL